MHQRRRGGEQPPLALRGPGDGPSRHSPAGVRVPGHRAGGGAGRVYEHRRQGLRLEWGRQKIGDGDPNRHSRALRRLDEPPDALASRLAGHHARPAPLQRDGLAPGSGAGVIHDRAGRDRSEAADERVGGVLHDESPFRVSRQLRGRREAGCGMRRPRFHDYPCAEGCFSYPEASLCEPGLERRGVPTSGLQRQGCAGVVPSNQLLGLAAPELRAPALHEPTRMGVARIPHPASRDRQGVL